VGPPLFKKRKEDEINLHQSLFSLDKIQDLTEIIIEHLGKKFDGEIFIVVMLHPSQSNQI